MKCLAELLQPFLPQKEIPAITLQGIESDSRKVVKGDLFIALPGTKQDGSHFIEQALQQGAVAILQQADEPHIHWQSSIPIIQIPQLREKLGLIASRFYDYPTRDLLVIGVTGTNGKTSISCLLAQALTQLGHKAGVIGTLGMGELGHLKSTGMTTPDALTLQQQFAQFKQAGFTAVVMEVSSHALAQYRVEGIEFDFALFTNLTRDHLDYHQTMEEYAAAKKRLFQWPGLRAAILNQDDEIGAQWIKAFQDKLPVCAYSLSDAAPHSAIAYVNAMPLTIDALGIHGQVKSSWGDGQLNSTLLGRFNASNLLAVLGTLLMLEVPLSQALTILQTCQGVAGRMQLVREQGQPLAVVDYAHTPDALEQVLKTLRELTTHNIICLFGCGGDRDPGKRPLMAKVAEKYADFIVITSDNPRSENPDNIISEIMQGISQSAKVLVERDRAVAIKLALKIADVHDIVLIAGKGHETTQIIQDKIHLFDDVAVTRQQMTAINRE